MSDELRGDMLDFSHQFVGRPFSKEVVVHNLGRRTMVLTWTNERAEEVKRQYAKAARAAGKKFDLGMVPVEEHPVWTLNPEKAVLEPKESAVFVLSGLSVLQGEMREQLTCMATAGSNSKTAKKVRRSGGWGRAGGQGMGRDPAKCTSPASCHIAGCSR